MEAVTGRLFSMPRTLSFNTERIEMSVVFSNHPDGYHIVSFQGLLEDQEMLERCRDFYENHWEPGWPQLSDLSQADFTEITIEGIQEMASYVQEFKSGHPGTAFKLGVYAPTDLPYGLARMYAALAEKSPGLVGVFRDYDEVHRWLLEA